MKRIAPILAFLLVASAWAADRVIVRPKEITDVLVNPGIGFTSFHRFNGDPLADIKSVRKLTTVVKNGQVFTLKELLQGGTISAGSTAR